jgi:DNA modification methylase
MGIISTLRHGDCVDLLGGVPEGSIGAVVCDPPYGLEFMQKDEKADCTTPSWEPVLVGRKPNAP